MARLRRVGDDGAAPVVVGQDGLGHLAPPGGGRGNLCANWNAIGDSVNGAFAGYVKVPAANAYRTPDSVDDAQGALIEPLSCADGIKVRVAPNG
jgi:threonine dehydrogenase-like Zn-dependent dehydrogenase